MDCSHFWLEKNNTLVDKAYYLVQYLIMGST